MENMVKNTNKKGFTIIEVVLVLAIAGLIFLMVFIALPALQRGQRNTQRKNDLSRFVTAATQYQANNSNKLPANDDAWNGNFVERYIKAGGGDEQFQDPDGENYWFWTYNKGSITKNCGEARDGKNCNPARGGLFSGFGIESSGNWSGHTILINKGAKCSEIEGKVDYSAGKNDFVMLMYLEGGSIACADNQ
ncbi:type II secretion system protein [Candidatus Saccharibacteria bacterium]|nr:type II secretion system protein [Candidatus Saccharibacteria bacterium]